MCLHFLIFRQSSFEISNAKKILSIYELFQSINNLFKCTYCQHRQSSISGCSEFSQFIR